jgi:hypothetical protein
MWNSWYNPYFYNPFYGGGVVLVGSSPMAAYNNLRPFEATNYQNGLAHYGATSGSRNPVYRPGMASTTAYNSGVSSRSSTFRPGNSNNGFRNFSAPTRSYSPSFGGSSGGFRGGSFGGRH